MSRFLAAVLAQHAGVDMPHGDLKVLRAIAHDAISAACSVIADRCEERLLSSTASALRSDPENIVAALAALIDLLDDQVPVRVPRAVFFDGRRAFDPEKPMRVLYCATAPFDPNYGVRGATPTRAVVLGSYYPGIESYIAASGLRDLAIAFNDESGLFQLRVTNFMIQRGNGADVRITADGYVHVGENFHGGMAGFYHSSNTPMRGTSQEFDAVRRRALEVVRQRTGQIDASVRDDLLRLMGREGFNAAYAAQEPVHEAPSTTASRLRRELGLEETSARPAAHCDLGPTCLGFGVCTCECSGCRP